ncbi:hypothetical protein IRJ41_024666, partial [Triplophysa rosa]
AHLTELIYFYFFLGLSHKDILLALSHVDRVIISMRTLRQHLKHLRLYRRKNQTDPLEVALFLVDELERYGKLHGYKLLHLKCIQAGFVVNQMQLRKRNRLRRRVYVNPGPNFMWHMDSYVKLKPFGICINGAIDGFSRMVIASYFINEIGERMGTPARLRSDLGTENCYVEQMQKFLRYGHNEEYAENCFIYGSSNHNQRIESWWAFMRKQHDQYWNNHFQDMKDKDYFTGDFLDRQLILFTCLNIIEEELQQVQHLWNSHRIRQSRNAEAVDACREECLQRGPYSCDESVFTVSCLLMEENHLHPPTTPDEAMELCLRSCIVANL